MATKSTVVPLPLPGPAPPLSGLQAKVTGMVETVKDSGVVDITLEEGEQQQETFFREGEQIGKHDIAMVFCDRGSQTRLRSQSISRNAESLNSHF